MQRHHESDVPSIANRSFVRKAKTPHDELAELLFAKNLRPGAGPPLPSLGELTAGLTSLARGLRRKVLLPLPSDPLEYAFVRRDGRVLVSVYETASAPEVHQLDHPVDLATLLEACARRALEQAQLAEDPVARQIAVRTAERARRTHLAPDPAASARSERHSYGSDEETEEALAFAFDARIHPERGLSSQGSPSRATASADIHALLFEGVLTARVRGRRLTLSRGPIVLAAQRMVVAVRALVDAWESGRPLNIKLRTGAFGIGIRLDRQERAELLLQARGETLRAAELHPEEIALPVLRLASELLRALVRTDRTQSRNLRVSALRDELRELRKAVRARRRSGFTNADPERLALSMTGEERQTSPGCAVLDDPASGIRYDERWRIDLGGLDAGATYFCGDRLVLATPDHTLAVDRCSGDVIWAREGSGSLLMAGRTLLRTSAEGDIELCDVTDGEPYALARVVPRVGGRELALAVGGGDVPPMAVIAEGTSRLVALDVRTGEPRWRFAAAGTRFETTRLGRLLLVATEGTIHAIDVATGEELWRHVARTRFAWAPIVEDDTVVAAGAGRHGKLVGIALGSGETRYERNLDGAVRAAPIAAGGVAVIAAGRELEGREPRTGERLWRRSDPGVGEGAATLDVDGLLISNAPGGRACALEAETGETRWMRPLGDPLADEVPRRLEPVLRGAALFVPAAGVFLVRPADGALLGEIDGDLVPDRIRVDERGWVYIAEESGHLAAYGPAPQLRVLEGGKR